MSSTRGVLYAFYGTLRKGFGNYNAILENNSEYIGTQTIKGNYRMVVIGGFPGVLPTKTESVIVVEVFRVIDPKVEASLDALEGYPGWYDKVRLQTEWGLANMYTLTEECYGHRPPVQGGDWKLHTQSK